MPKKYVVTGAAGFIGSNLVRYLLENTPPDSKIIAIDDFSTGKAENLSKIRGSIDLVKSDIRNRSIITDLLPETDAIFHLAAFVSVPRSVRQPDLVHKVNVRGTFDLLEAARAAGIKRFVFASSSAAYGDVEGSPKFETDPVHAASPYAASKIAGESFLQSYAASYSMETVSLRFFNVFGPRQNPAGVYAAAVSAFMAKLYRNEAPVIFGDGEQTRDFCYVEDICRACYLAANIPGNRCRGNPINIGTGVPTTLNELLETMQKALRIYVPVKFASPRQGDVLHSCASIKMAEEILGYTPQFSLMQGIKKYAEWWEEQMPVRRDPFAGVR